MPALPSGVLAGSVPMLAGAAKGTLRRVSELQINGYVIEIWHDL
jgi:hypothetical protein